VPFSSLIRKERLDLIKGLNHMLSRRQKQVFNLLIEGFTNDEIGNTLRMGAKNVQATKSRLIQRIRNFVLNNKNENYHKY
jgi:DNA-binding NarL/FixJ family response regulator